FLELLGGEAEPHLVVVGILARRGAAAGGVRVVPVFHVVLLGQPGRTRVADVVVTEEILHLGRRVGVDEIDPPALGLMWSARMPHGERPGLARERRCVRKHGARAAKKPPELTATALPLGLA